MHQCEKIARHPQSLGLQGFADFVQAGRDSWHEPDNFGEPIFEATLMDKKKAELLFSAQGQIDRPIPSEICLIT